MYLCGLLLTLGQITPMNNADKTQGRTIQEYCHENIYDKVKVPSFLSFT
jgi:hypothetical protein